MAEPSFPPYNVTDLGTGVKRRAPAAARNVGPIGDVLQEWLPQSGLVLEIASGTGEHALAFARRSRRLPLHPLTEVRDIVRRKAWLSHQPPPKCAPSPVDDPSGAGVL